MTPLHRQEELPLYHPTTSALLKRIGSARFRSELSARSIMMEAGRARVPAREIDIIDAARNARWGQLTMSYDVEHGLDIPEPPEQLLPAEEPWSPTSGMTDEGVSRELDWRERQLPNGDRD